MKRLAIFILLAMFLSFSHLVLADESLREKINANKNDTNGQVNKAVNRAQEVSCADGDLECLQRKAEQRIKEVYDSTKDKASEIRNKVDDAKK